MTATGIQHHYNFSFSHFTVSQSALQSMTQNNRYISIATANACKNELVNRNSIFNPHSIRECQTKSNIIPEDAV